MSTILFGGSFDPVHRGHLQIADFARHAVSASRVLFIPSGRPFGKPDYYACAEDRVVMLEKALAGHHWADICLYEVQNALQGHPEKHYSIDTVRFLKKHGLIEDHPFLLVGDDLISTFSTWKDYQTLADLVTVIVAVRQGQTVDKLDFPHVLLQNMPLIYASSQIRADIAAGKSYQRSVPKEVYYYIESHQLYRQFR